MTLLLILKAIIVVFFLVMFLRRPQLAWGVGLLTVTSAVLLDTFLGTFGREETIAELGFFFYIIAGGLFGGGALWIWGMFRPLSAVPRAAPRSLRPHANPSPQVDEPVAVPEAETQDNESQTAFDRRMLFDEIRNRLGREDVLDLMFDLEINENDVMSLHQDMNQLIINLMDVAVSRGDSGALTLAVERILTPMPPERLPRLEKISEDSPPTILRHYLLAHFDLTGLAQVAADLELDWEQLGAGDKREKVRNLLLYLYRRNRIGELIGVLQETDQGAEDD